MSTNPKIVIAVPTYDSMKPEFVTSLLKLSKYQDTIVSVISQSLVYVARNNLFSKAIDYNADYVLWLDSDMVFPSNTLEVLLEDARQGMDYVSGLYFSRIPPINPVISKKLIYEQTKDGLKHGSETYKDYPKDSVFEIAGSGFGCVLTNVHSVAEMVVEYDEPPFLPMKGFGEDYSFCYKFSKMGKKMYCDSRIKCGHVGSIIYDEQFYLKRLEDEKK